MLFHSRQTASAVLLIVALTGASCWASIETEPVKVTHRNSGPRYDVDEVERTRLSPDSSENQVTPPRPSPPRAPQEDEAGEPEHVGHISIRRIFLVPMMPPTGGAQHGDGGLWSGGPSGQAAQGGERGERPEETEEQPRMPVFNMPSFWHNFGLAPPSRPHMFGGDEASRPPSPMTPEASMNRPATAMGERPAGEREAASAERPHPPLMDPLQMMLELMQQALNPAAMMPSAGNNPFATDLNRDASNNKPTERTEDGNTKPDLMKPADGGEPIPMSRNETKEEVIEVDGKKYLKKTVINRHVGENIVFMTKRLIFVPLNETDTTETGTNSTAATTPAAPAAGAATDTIVTREDAAEQASGNPKAGDNERRNAEEATTTISSTTTTTSTSTSAPTNEPPATTAAPSEAPTSSSSVATSTSTEAAGTTSGAEETTPKDQTLVAKVSELFDRAAERLIEKESSTQKPVESPQP